MEGKDEVTIKLTEEQRAHLELEVADKLSVMELFRNCSDKEVKEKFDQTTWNIMQSIFYILVDSRR